VLVQVRPFWAEAGIETAKVEASKASARIKRISGFPLEDGFSFSGIILQGL
jgi:hypothetical protein